MKTILDTLTSVLSKEAKFVSDGFLLKNTIIEAALSLDPALLKLLLESDELKAYFFQTVGKNIIFDKIKFQRFISNKQFLPDSYTKFKNKIGLINEFGFISNSENVILSWPYKDCVLEGGQTKEESNRKEVFWNETLAPEQIDRLLSPKVLTNFKRFNKEGETIPSKVSTADNLVIKGNNLLALHTLKKTYANQIKLIYLDPPFNTENDDFQYNDTFTHSTWLTFMKNRLEIAYELLAPNGAIFTHLDHEEAPYLKVLMDEVFGRENWINTFTVTTNDPSGFKATSKGIFSTANQIFFYAKNKNQIEFARPYIKNEYDSNYNQYLKNKNSPFDEWEYEPLSNKVAIDSGYKSARLAKSELGNYFEDKVAEFAFKNAANVFRTASIQGGARAKRLETINLSIKNKGKVFVHPGDENNGFYILNGEQIIFYENRLVEIDGELVAGKLLTDVWTDIKVTGIADEGGVKLKNGKKPEKLIKRILDIATTEGDLVLDFFAGSGTTAAVAHKMGRRYITVEQMDYIEEITLKRLKNVISGDTTGISQTEKWTGGGEFIYCELLTLNQSYADNVIKSKTTKELLEIWDEIKSSQFISYKVNPKDFDSNIKEFEKLDFELQKKMLLEILDKNMLYVPFSEIEDKTYMVSDDIKAFNLMFQDSK